MTIGNQKNPGAVKIVVLSPTRIILIIEDGKPEPLWKIPGGSLRRGEGVIAGAIRECEEETGIRLLPEEIHILSKERLEGRVYHPFYCAAFVSEEKLDTRKLRTYEGGDRRFAIRTGLFPREEPLRMPDLLQQHLPAIEQALEFCRRTL